MSTGGSFAIVPQLSYRAFRRNFTPLEIEGNAGSFTAGRGRLDITVLIADSSYMFNITVVGGYSWNINDPISYFVLLKNSIISTDNLTTATSSLPGGVTTITVTTGPSDLGGRKYELVFPAYPTILPTIEKVLGAALGGGVDVIVKNVTSG